MRIVASISDILPRARVRVCAFERRSCRSLAGLRLIRVSRDARAIMFARACLADFSNRCSARRASRRARADVQ